MSNVLDTIVADKRIEVEKLAAELPLASFKDGLTPSEKSLFHALSGDKAGYILECKKASPSKGLIREVFDLDEIIAAYGPFAAGISVLTDEKYFQGRYEYLDYVTKRVSQPVLNKDFFVNEYQVYRARYHNADAILLMLSVLTDEEYERLAKVADSLSLDILTEVSNEAEMMRAIKLKAQIIGINNRDLRDLSTDLATTERLVPMLADASHDYVVISESGIYTHADVQRLSPLCNGFLVGSALMAQPKLHRAVASLVVGQVKVCGIARASDAHVAFNSGASLCGLIFYAGSKRAVTPEQAAEITAQVPGEYVGVFVNETVETVVEIASKLGLSAVQLHGSEDQAYRAKLKQKLPSACQLWQASGIGSTLDPNLGALYQDSNVDYVLLDCKVGEQSGGTGQAFDWRLLDNIPDKSRTLLAGGLNAGNILAAKATGVAGLDVNSGVEEAPGIKSPQQITELFTLLRANSLAAQNV